MKTMIPRVLAILLLVAAARTAAAQAGEVGGRRDDYRSETWPGRDGKPRVGCDLREVGGAGLQADPVTFQTDGWMVRRFRTDEGALVAVVRARVLDTPAEAHQELLRELRLRSQAEPYPRGETLGLTAGDVRFADGTAGQLEAIRMVRSNVVVRIDRVDPGRAVDLAELARRADAAILRQREAAGPAELPRPAFTALAAGATILGRGASTVLTAETGRDVEILFEIVDGSEGSGTVERREGRTVFVGSHPGRVTLRCHAIARTGLRATAELAITVVE